MRRSFLARVTIVAVAGLGLLGSLLLGTGCVDPVETCSQLRTCGSKTLSGCSNDADCRYKSSDGHAWSCKGTKVQSTYGDSYSCTGSSCEIAAQEASDWCFSQSSATTPTVAGQVIVTELMHNPDVVDDDLGEWFEIYSPGGDVLDLFGCQIRDRESSHTIATHFLVPPRAFRTAAIFSTGGGFTPDYTYSGITFDNNAADEVSLWCGETLIDRFAYSSSQASTSGHALSWDPSGYEARPVRKDDPQYVCPATTPYNTANTGSGVIHDYGTPGALNPHCP